MWSIALTVDADRRGRARRTSSSTPPSSAVAQLGNVSSFGVDADGELYVVSYSRGTILKIIGADDAPGAPTGLRIIR